MQNAQYKFNVQRYYFPPVTDVSYCYFSPFRLQYEQDVLIDKINATLEKFDADLRTLRHDKMHLEIALKCADLR